LKLLIPAWEIPTLAVVGSTDRFSVRRVFCMGLNYLDHKGEMGTALNAE
jgi:fumarylpyruvate hydrolase